MSDIEVCDIGVWVVLSDIGDTEVCPGPTPREIPELDALLEAKGLYIFHQNVKGLLSNKDYLVELIDSFKKVQVFTLTRHT